MFLAKVLITDCHSSSFVDWLFWLISSILCNVDVWIWLLCLLELHFLTCVNSNAHRSADELKLIHVTQTTCVKGRATQNQKTWKESKVSVNSVSKHTRTEKWIDCDQLLGLLQNFASKPSMVALSALIF